MVTPDVKIVRKYRKEFETEFSWSKCEQNADGSESAFCQFCEISITPTSSCLITHEASARHQKNVYDIKKTGHKTPAKQKEDGPKASMWKKDYDKTRRFHDEWLERFPWVQKDPDGDRFGFCPHCNIKLEPKAKRLEDHEKTTKHMKNAGIKISSVRRATGSRIGFKKFRGRKRKMKKAIKKEEPATGEEESLSNQFAKISDISELMEGLPTLLEEETDEGSTSKSDPTKIRILPPRKRGRPKAIKDEEEDDIAEEETEDNVNEVGEVVEAEEGEMVEYIAVNQDDQLLHSDITIKEQLLHGQSSTVSEHEPDASTSGQGPIEPASNRWSEKFPWVVVDFDDSAFPCCKFCQVIIEPDETKLERHQETRRHINNEKNGVVHIVFRDSENISDEQEPSMEGLICATKSQPNVVKREPKTTPTKTVERVRNPPTKRVQALKSKKNISATEIENNSTISEQDNQSQGVVQDVSAVEIIETTPVEINLVLPVSDDVTGHVLAVNDGMEGEGHPTGEHVNISEYVNILIEPQDQEMMESAQQHQGEELDDSFAEHDPDSKDGEWVPADDRDGIDNRPRRRYTRRNPNEPKTSGWRKEYEKSRRFQPEWLTDHPWVRRETRPSGVMAFCPYCNVDLEPRVVRLRQHEKTSKHRKNEEVHSKRVIEEEAYLAKNPKRDSEPADKKFKLSPIKTEVRPRYKCDLCSLRFVAQRNLYLHLKEHYEPGTKDTTSASQQPEPVLEDEPEPEREEVKYEYKPAWERIFPWLQKAVDDDWAFCSLCKFPMEPKLSIIKAHLKHRRHVKLVSQQDNPTQFEPRPDTTGILAEDEKQEKKKRNSIIGNADVVTDVDGRQKYQCKVCKKILVKTSFAVHLRIHQGLRPFQCTMCEWAFKQAYDLKHHVESIHNNIKAHQCELCGKEFTRKYTLRLHQKSHTDVRDFKCTTCQRGFFTRGKLVEHERTHTGEKPFLCDFCGRGFRIKYDMVQHRLKTHYGVPPKRRKPTQKMPSTTTTTTYQLTTKDGEMIDDQGHVMTVDESVEVEMEDHTVHTVHTIDGAYEQKHQLVFISETEAVFLTK